MSSSLAPFVMLAMPFIEIAGFIVVGSYIGVFATLGLIILSAMLGFFLLRVQGIGLLQRIRTETAAGRVPDREMVHGAMLVLAAILLIVPGFVTSAVGILLFIPFVRDIVWEKFVRGRMVVATSTHYSQSYRSHEPRPDRVIDLDMDDYTSRPNEDSPWNRDPKDR
ncbi:FxsA family protein [Brucella melitensis]|uniref:FxsA family protein n=1 Tax=Brucella melitensis TaxID=29459 RepID=UPI0001B59540|nr:FxsA family protein [Brucella melitensis]AIJ85162.1 fxsA cytoplasmic membrane family protein [Brucella melitensis bv. 3 str. Ether]AOG50591.1 membrane protein FxsA [Brucella melitensis]ARY25450.1 membrane protein FxsA [Brucella melitensis]ARY28649.1 membrane protein FxsA [Brucella melitensis]ARY38099.1 membrane protein FxsA [Brucella melitensis]